MRRANLLGFFAAMVLICRAVPNPALSNRNDPTARGVPALSRNTACLWSWWGRTTSLLSSSLNPCRLIALDLSLPSCLSAELEAPRTLSSLCADRIFKLLFTSLRLGCCKVPGAPSPEHSECSCSSKSARQRNIQVANLQKKIVGMGPE